MGPELAAIPPASTVRTDYCGRMCSIESALMHRKNSAMHSSHICKCSHSASGKDFAFGFREYSQSCMIGMWALSADIDAETYHGDIFEATELFGCFRQWV